MTCAAETLKRVTLELGGNDAAIVLDDVDPGLVAPGLFMAAFINSGQACVATKRLYVHESIYDGLVVELSKLANAAVVGRTLSSCRLARHLAATPVVAGGCRRRLRWVAAGS